MSRAMLKRPRDAFDSSPASSTPPGPQRPAKRYHIDSDASSDSFAFHLPSDSPSNPFGRFKPFVPRDLPRAIPISDHLVLRFQLGQQAHSVHRIVTVPANFTFWHLHRLAMFLFNWKDIRKEKNPLNKSQRIERRVEHIFTVQKRVVFYTAAKHLGLFKNGASVVHVAGNVKELKPRCRDDVPWEREECYTLNHLWNRPDSPSALTRAIIYEYDVLSTLKEAVYISLHSDSEKLKSSVPDLFEVDESNVPQVLAGSGLPDDDDDEDLALDLEQWNEPNAFENFLFSQEDLEEEDEDDCPSTIRLEKEQALVKKRMSAPLPKRLPLDEDEHEDLEEDVPQKVQMLTSKAQATSAAPSNPPKPAQPETKEKREVITPTELEFSPVKKRVGSKATATAASVHLPDPEESLEIIAAPLPLPRKRAPFAPRLPGPAPPTKEEFERQLFPESSGPSLPDPEESREVGDDGLVARPRRRSISASVHLPDPEESLELEIYEDVSPRRAKRAPLGGLHLPDPDESREVGADYEYEHECENFDELAAASRKGASLDTERLSNPEEDRELYGEDEGCKSPSSLEVPLRKPSAIFRAIMEGRESVEGEADVDEVDELADSDAEV